MNFLSDFPLIAIATDRIDIEELTKPKTYKLKQIISLIVLLAMVSTVFDFIFFAIFHKAEPSLLQTLWFIESILTEILLIYSVRTKHFFLRTALPSLPLVLFSLLAIVATLSLPFFNFGRKFFSFSLPPLSSVLIVIFLLISF